MGILIIFAPPLALAVSIVGLFKDKSKVFAIIGLAISGITLFLFLASFLAAFLCKR